MQRFKHVTKQLFRGSAPSAQEVGEVHHSLGIKRIVSLDKLAGEVIAPICQHLGIDHFQIPIDFSRFALLNFLSYDLKKLLLSPQPTFIHCMHGKDRTGLACALIRVQQGWSAEKALAEAKSLDFGARVDPIVVQLFEKIIRTQAKSNHDENALDIVDNVHEYYGDTRDSYLDEANRKSFSPYLSTVRQYPYEDVYNPNAEQTDTRESHGLPNLTPPSKPQSSLPLVGQYDNASGVRGVGPVDNGGGFVNI